MAWDATAPRGSDPIGVSDDFIRANFDALQIALSGTHIFPGALTTHGMHVPGKVPICEVDTEAVISGYTDIAGSICWPTDLATLYTNNGISWDGRGPFSGTINMIFFQATAPTGWTILTVANDGIVYSTDVAASGGSSRPGGTWTISGLEYSHYHIYSQVPWHRHLVTVGPFIDTGGIAGSERVTTFKNTSYYDTQTSYNTSSSSGAISSDGSWRPKRAISIIAMKD